MVRLNCCYCFQYSAPLSHRRYRYTADCVAPAEESGVEVNGISEIEVIAWYGFAIVTHIYF